MPFLHWPFHLVIHRRSYPPTTKGNSKRKTLPTSSHKMESPGFIPFYGIGWVPPSTPKAKEKTLCTLKVEAFEAGLRQGWSLHWKTLKWSEKDCSWSWSHIRWYLQGRSVDHQARAVFWEWSRLLAWMWSPFWPLPVFWAGASWIATQSRKDLGDCLSSLQGQKCTTLTFLAGLCILARIPE